MRVSKTFKLLLVLLSVTIAIVTSEIAARLLIPKNIWNVHGSSELLQPDSTLGWSMKASTQIPLVQGWSVSTNRDGLRPASAEQAKNPDVFRILIVGDSTVIGIGVPPDQTLDSHLSRLFANGSSKVEVLNAGVEGYSTDQALLRANALLPIYQPDLLIYGFCLNDLYGNAMRVNYRRNKPSYILRDGQLSFLPLDKPNAKITDVRAPFAKILQKSALFMTLRPSLVNIRERFEQIKFGSDMGKKGGGLNEKDWILFTRLLAEFKRITKENGASFAFISHPSIEEVWLPQIKPVDPPNEDHFAAERRLMQIARDTGVDYIPMVDYFLKNAARGPFHLLPRDPHSNGTGYLLIAERLQAYIVKRLNTQNTVP